VLLGLLLATAAYVAYQYLSVESRLAPPPEDQARVETVLDDTPSSGESTATPYTYVLLLGEDRQGAEGPARSDTIILARLSERDGSVLMLSIPRDTRVSIPGYEVSKINHAAAWGGAPLAIETVKAFTGLPVHHYVTIEHLDGLHALAVVRNRKAYPDGDLARTRNQRAFLSAVARKMTVTSNLAKLPHILSLIADNVETDLSVGEITALLKEYREALQGDLPGYTVRGSGQTIDGQYYMVPDEAAAKALFDAIRRGETPPE